MNDFSPETRRSGWWTGDSRRAVSGHLVEVLLEKRNQKQPDDLSGIEAVQMGHVMQPVIGRLFEDATGIRVKDYDLAGQHHKELWLKAHTDFESADGGLLEVKNFNAAVANKYPDDDDWQRLPAADLIQCVHEATVFGKPHVWFAVLFGGQRFRYWKIEVTEEMKLEFIQQAAKWWALSHTGDLPDAETVEQAKMIYTKVIDDTTVVSTAQVERVIASLKEIKAQIKMYETQEEACLVSLQNYMRNNTSIITPYNEVLVTWKQSKSSKSFDKDLFKQAMPDIYEQFVVEKPGSRRFLVK
jgi:predicted phage-related endonuclease